MKLQRDISFPIIGDIAINLSAAWLAAAFIVPNFSSRSTAANVLILILDLTFAMVFAGIAYFFKQRSRKTHD